MIKPKFRISAIIIFVCFITACSSNANLENKETPKALQDHNSEIKSYRGSNNDLVEELYQGLVDKSADLKKLEEQIKSIRPAINDANEQFSNYDSKSNSYYNSANTHSNQISDSLLKKKIQGIISSSNKQYLAKRVEVASLQEVISKNNSSISDYHTVLKIVLTLPIIETYQHDNAISPQEFKVLVNKQLELINSIKKMTPAF
jgi:chromosome segregation ATPase